MTRLEKINEKNNVLTWFEIPAQHLLRAKSFYEKLLEIKMPLRMDGDFKAAFFPYDQNSMQASSGRVTGTIIQVDPASKSFTDHSYNGVIVYLNASPSIDEVLNRVQIAGGQVLEDKNRIPPGWIAKIKDTEGNIIGLFSES